MLNTINLICISQNRISKSMKHLSVRMWGFIGNMSSLSTCSGAADV